MKYLIALFIMSNCMAGKMVFEVNDKNGKTIKREFIQANNEIEMLVKHANKINQEKMKQEKINQFQRIEIDRLRKIVIMQYNIIQNQKQVEFTEKQPVQRNENFTSLEENIKSNKETLFTIIISVITTITAIFIILALINKLFKRKANHELAET